MTKRLTGQGLANALRSVLVERRARLDAQEENEREERRANWFRGRYAGRRHRDVTFHVQPNATPEELLLLRGQIEWLWRRRP